MFKGPFWISCLDLLRHKRAITGAVAATLVAALCFGAGLAMIYPIFSLFFGTAQAGDASLAQNPLPAKIHQFADTSWFPYWISEPLHALAEAMPTDALVAFIAVMGVIYAFSLVANLMRYIQQLLISHIAEQLAADYREKLYTNLIEAPTEHFMREGAADHASKIWIDVRVLTNAQVTVFGKGLFEGARGLAALVTAFFFDPLLVSVCLITAPPTALLIRRYGTRIRRSSRGALDLYGVAMSRLNASISGLSTIKVFTAESYERRRFRLLNRQIYRQMMNIREARAKASPSVEVITMIGVVAAATLAAWYIIRHGADPSAALATLGLLAGAAAGLKPVTQLHNVIHQADPAAKRILDATGIDTEPTRYDATAQRPPLPRHSRSVVFDAVTYHYPDAETPALDGITLEVEAGSTTAIVGGNGAGKSTLLYLIPRLIEPASGRVLIDDTDITTVSLRSLRKQIAVVPQKTHLFEGTIAENIAYGSSERSLDDIEAAARAAFAHEFIDALPEGYLTRLGESGSGLSGGQGQRIAIARAILRNPAILILDEATSQIDAESEAKINQAIDRFAQQRTTFVIAHRMSTVVNADRIVVMDRGRVIDVAPHSVLLERCELYHNLSKTQLDAGS
ncbi:ABC transporter ATP-binding protein [Mucisphaera calidilacus]|uniref:Lipid A export ATP-binding/permease protein MsbA n=1 Tax=Mucisphaera calidilacus TaxID=2527982 RepID=A0A518BV32_9BACT|nr:ABC transporter ATP-binding protein [Mucisphaera calidilacus]QDU70821.1 Lipid A export ATP-binding/permease protein MsbA [Mucisphaera calidilacus]